SCCSDCSCHTETIVGQHTLHTPSFCQKNNFKTIPIGEPVPTMEIPLEQKSAFFCRKVRKCAFLRWGESKGGVQERGAATQRRIPSLRGGAFCTAKIPGSGLCTLHAGTCYS
ncbi:hypothetical protein, partial [uncultured Gemmiger sp.]|uniref:hypothetical protein n=1 Tax=uncultured Gemmiger sp. TaxID=1623490 RepID=UPI0025D23BD7